MAALETFNFREGVWSECSEPCNSGTQTRTIECIKQSDSSVVADSQCSGQKQATQQVCNVDICVWQPGDWGTCNKQCNGGTRSRTVQCLSPSSAAVAASLCLGGEPAQEESCNLESCAWNEGQWSTCTQDCGGGQQTRSVECRDPAGGTVAGSLCTASQPSTQRPCNEQACDTFNFREGAWSECSKPCNSGTQTRTIECIKQSDSSVVADSECLKGTTPKPASVQACNLALCSWKKLQWGPCTEPCNGGLRTRIVSCHTSTDNKEVLDSNCDATSRPPEEENCNEDGCRCTCPCSINTPTIIAFCSAFWPCFHEQNIYLQLVIW